MKKDYKPILENAFKDYLTENNYNLQYKYSFSTTQFTISKNEKENEPLKFEQRYAEEYLYELAYSKMNKSIFFGFVEYLIEKEGNNQIVNSLLVEKTPHISIYDDTDYIKYQAKAVKILKRDNDKLMSYITKNAFISNNLSLITYLLDEKALSEENKEVLLECMVNHKGFRDLEFKKKIYKIYKDHMAEKVQYESFFSEISSKSEKNIVEEEYLSQIYSIKLNIESVSLTGGEKIVPVDAVRYVLGNMPKVMIDLKDRIGITDIKMFEPSPSSKQLIWIGNNLDNNFLMKLTKEYIKVALYEYVENNNKNKDVYSELVSSIRAEILSEKLPNKTDIQFKKSKI